MQGPGGVADDDDARRDVARDDRPGADEGAPADGATLEHDGTRADGRPGSQVDRAADPGPGEHGDEVVQDAVVTDGGAVLHLDVVAEPDAAADVRQGHDDAPRTQDGVGTDDGGWVHEGDRGQPIQVEDQSAADLRVGDPDDHAPVNGLGRQRHRQASNSRPGRPLVEEAAYRQDERQRDVQDLTAGPAGPDDEEVLRRGVHDRHPAAPTRRDALTLLLLGFLAAWTAGAGGRPGPEVTLIGGVAVTYLLGRLLSAWPQLVGATGLALAGAVAVAVLGAPDGLSGGPLAGPLGYGNANGALCVVGTGGALLALVTWRRAGLLVLPLAAGMSYLALLTGSTAATVLCAGLLLVGATLWLRPRWSLAVAPLAAAGLLVAIAGTVVLAGLGPSGGGQAEELLSGRRVVLWAESIDLVRADPLQGVGADRFATSAPTALADADARWSHSVWLQQAAETGIPGAGLLLAASLSVLRRRASAAAAMALAVVAAVLLHASVDYVLHTPAISLLCGLLAGLGGALRGRDHRATSAYP